MRAALTVIVLALSTLALQAQTGPLNAAQPDPPHREWRAAWITHPTAPLRDPVVLHFRRTLALVAVPATYPVRVSADNRFVLFVNGHRVGDGPARGDLAHWRYKRFDLAPFLQPGQNLITATVWNFGVYAPLAQMTDRAAFLLESEATGAAAISTPEDWLVEIEPGQRPLPRLVNGFWEYMAAGTGEEIDGARDDWSWNSPSAVGPAWVAVASPIRESIYPTSNKAHSADVIGDNSWCLVPDSLPAMEYSPTSPGEAVRLDMIAAEQPGLSAFPVAPAGLPPGVHVHLLLDRKTLTTAYPQLTVSGGKGAKIRLTYSEALYDQDQHKGDRDEVGNRTALGTTDSFLPDGGAYRTFEPLWWRTWRYLDLDIQTAADPLQLESLTASFTAYPFEQRASFHSGDAELDKIWEISWRTARLDAHETYMDTPYYEQFQYVGDTRIQALISYAVAGDDRLARQAIAAFDQSRTADGLTMSRYPSSLPQIIPTFSLLWIGMVHDYWLYRPDPEPARATLPGTRAVLAWFATHEQPDGLLQKLPWWSFVDWVPSGEIPTYDANHESCVTTLEYLGALNDAADLEESLGDPLLTARYQARAVHVRDGLFNKCWNAQRGLIADNPDQKNFSQQANILAVLYDVVPKDRQQELVHRMLAIEPGTTPDGILSASYYFRFYLARALDHAGLADEYLRSIDPWRKLLPLHFSTWPEVPGNTRSDSHAWSAHPIYDLLALVAGIQPASPGFATVRIAPHLGTLPSLTATYPHPEGIIKVEYRRHGEELDATITLPGKLTGNFVFNSKVWQLKPGVNQILAP
ncbi:MAG TPA: alpha-L-rhamnosidase C-terminal domain-containing protein [Terracidiphilus sp.]|nr:alpha-L-rhamnosidase C-terminal domain-containing protein [Terracidiphilus sp.]